MPDLLAAIKNAGAFAQVIEHVRAGHSCAVGGLWGSSCACFLAGALDSCPSIVLAVTAGPEEADDLSNDINLFRPGSAVVFPAREALPAEEAAINYDILGRRVEMLRKLLFHGSGEHADGGIEVVVTPIQSLMQPVVPPSQLQADIIALAAGTTHRMENIAEWLVERSFERVPMVEMHGEFSIRGGILDIFPAGADNPIRAEFFGDQIESLREFEVSTQRSIKPLERYQLAGVSRDETASLLAAADLSTSLFTYLPKSSWIVLHEPIGVQERAESIAAALGESEEFFTFRGIYAASRQYVSIHATGLPAASDLPAFDFHTGTAERFGGDLKQIIEELHRQVELNEALHIYCENEAQEKRLKEVLKDTNLADEPKLIFERGFLSAGFRLEQPPVACIGHHEIFSRYQRLRTVRPRRRGAPIESFLELHKGDYVVHVAHGIAKFRGMETLRREGEMQEFLLLEFAQKTKLYVPASKIDLVQRYVGPFRARPRLSTLGGKRWGEKKVEAKRATQDLAIEMLEVQAIRARSPGIVHPPDSLWQHEFEDSFLYQETDDQVDALAQIKNDMESPAPMDRLLCGDVGYGKTELAMRAAFKTATFGKQVAVLVPTTVLAAQHLRTFNERTADFPLVIEMLSRFKTKKEQKEIIERLKRGQVDIVIGTHRLLSKDIEFRDLGLLVIDEEQRFGVHHKERLKQYRKTVDVLTMTATPIPRTLHMSLLGIRDISSLSTPPQDRQSIRSEVCRFDEHKIRDALLREIHRDGQVFFVHNRVYNIESIRDQLRDIVPEATYTIGHGQMNEHELERRMAEFVAGHVDVLVCTTIIESGLDIPNANTIIINRADNFGLADLHQLRGRVGRYKNRAYAYFLVPPDKPITHKSVRRLKAIEEYSELGAGFKIAMRDLEIRGAGNILGTQQSGHIAAIGYDLYCKLLDQTVHELRNEPVPQPISAEIQISLDAFIPDDYAPDPTLKMGIYRKLAGAVEVDEIGELVAELIDRFGDPPQPVTNLIERHELRVLATRRGINYIATRKGYLLIKYSDAAQISQLRAQPGLTLRVIDTENAHLHYPPATDTPRKIAAFLKTVLSS
ncbi:MAG: transcription-repair coupling factor [Planctomycetes bacterium]|nr:transcription-repair coupling factor [Planctomycetota bacterium]